MLTMRCVASYAHLLFSMRRAIDSEFNVPVVLLEVEKINSDLVSEDVENIFCLITYVLSQYR